MVACPKKGAGRFYVVRSRQLLYAVIVLSRKRFLLEGMKLSPSDVYTAGNVLWLFQY